MGCTSTKLQQLPPLKLPTHNGILKITILNAKIQHQTSTLFTMDPYLKLSVSNQSAISKIIPKGGKQPIFNQTFEFFINSSYQSNGRHLQLQLWDSNKTSDSLIGVGMLDLDTIIQPNKQTSKETSKQTNKETNKETKPKPTRILLNYNVKSAGVVNALFQFVQHPIQLLNFRFQTISIRRKTSSTPNCYVKVTIGEQVLKTKNKKDTPQMPPVWKDQIITINVPKIIKNCLIEVFDDDQLIGDSVVKIQDLLKEKKQTNYDEEIFFREELAGTLKFQTMIGENVVFSELKKDYKRKIESKKQEVVNPEAKEGEKGKEGQKGGNEEKGKSGDKNEKAQQGVDKEKQKQVDKKDKQTQKPKQDIGVKK